ncbi:MAG: helicase-related protein [Ancalomicrobiaceae bacterium]|nr:helicase-related protein [Ancalomicrobiaceae bacterium]
MNFVSPTTLPASVRAKTVTAVLGPTNTGKTHMAIERMLAHKSGLIGLPLRLLAREVYNKIADRSGVESVALITGEEQIVPKEPRYWVSTVEAMPRSTDVDFVAIDEVQLAADLERGHIFTDRILNLRGRGETLLLGAATVRGLLERLLPGLNVVTRPRMSSLTYAGQKKITRLPARSAVVAFSAEEVYTIAELVRRQRGGAAVVLGALSPRTRNAQVELFQSGDVDFLVATDAIGMGLNLDVDHIAFAGNRKFDGYQYRQLSAGELGQIAGRAGRHTRDGTFGVTGRVDPFDDDLVRALEQHQFMPLKVLQWRNPQLDFSSLAALKRTLELPPREDGLTRAPPADDEMALDHVCRDPMVTGLATTQARIRLLWDVAQLPDYRRIAPANHAELVSTVYEFLARDGVIRDDWFNRQVAQADRIDGDIDTLANRIAHIRTWTFIANRADWLADSAHWREKTRAIEDRLSDALHDRLTQRFVDRRTSVLMRRLRENAMLEAEITAEGDVLVEGHRVGQLSGFRFVPDPSAEGTDAKAVRNAAAKSLASEIEARADKLSRAQNTELVLSSDGTLRWLGDVIARLSPGEDTLKPGYVLLADEQLTGPAREKVDQRLSLWVKAHVEALLKPLTDLRDAQDLEGIARGLAFQLVEALGVLERNQVADEVKTLDQPMRASLRKYGVRFGAYHIFLPALLKPASSGLIAELWSLKNPGTEPATTAALHQLSASGRTSIPVDKTIPKALYKVVGFRVCGERAVRIDILERLADIIRPLVAWKPLDPSVQPPEGAVPNGGGFTVTVAMTSLCGCSGEDFSSILKSLGYRVEKRTIERVVRHARSERHEGHHDGHHDDHEAFADAAPVAETVATTAVEPAVLAPAEPEVVEPVEIEAPEASVAEVQPTEPAIAEAEPAETVIADAEPVQAPAADEPSPIAEAAAATGEEEASASEAPASEEQVSEELAHEEPVLEETASEDGVSEETATEEPSSEPAEAAETAASPAEPVEAETAEAAAPTETVEIDVWRPGRFERRDDHHRRGPPRGERSGGEPRQPRVYQFPNARPAGQAESQQRPASDAEPSSYAGEAPHGDRPPRSDRPRGDFNRPRNTDDRRGENRGDARSERGERQSPEGAQGRGGGNPNRGAGASGDRRQDKPQKLDKPLDPNSPFAALLALKAELEAKQKGDKK